MSSVTLRDVFVYRLDRILSGHPAGRLLVLGLVAALAVLFSGLLRRLVSDDGMGQSLWWSIIATLDPVKFAEEERSGPILVGVLASMCGLVVIASLIGLINSSIEQRLELLQKGRSPVIANGHILVLNWTQEKVLSILRELATAAQCRETTARTVVLLSSQEKAEVEDLVYAESETCAYLDVVVRTGAPSSPSALLNAGADRASCIIVLNPDLDPTSTRFGESDREIVKTLLALRKVAKNATVVAELCSTDQLPILPSIFHGRLEPVIMSDTLARILVQTARTKGLSEVFADLLTFHGSELYFRQLPEFDGLAFGEIQWRLYDAVPIGYARQVDGRRKVVLNPPISHIVNRDDFVLLLSESGHSFSIGPAREVNTKLHPKSESAAVTKVPHAVECVCIVGFSSRLPFILKEFDSYMQSGSLIYLVTGREDDPSLVEVKELKNTTVKMLKGRSNDPQTLETALQLRPKSVIVVAEEGQTYDDADAQTISTVLLINLLQQKCGGTHVRVICELLDPSSKDLLDEDVGCDFVLSSEITSRLIAQLSIDGTLREVFEELFTAEGNEIYLKSPGFYCGGNLEHPARWLDIQARAMKFSEVAIGYFHDGKSFLNPKQDVERLFLPEDRIIVISENEDEMEF